MVTKSVWYRHKDRQVDQWNRLEDPEKSPHSYSHLIFDKGAKNIHWRKKQPLHQKVLEILNIHI
jgi:hypothetical protein